MDLLEKERIIVFNKIDKLNEEELAEIKKEYSDAVYVSAFKRATFTDMLNKIGYYFFKEGIEGFND